MGGLISASTAMANTSCMSMDTKLGMMVATPFDTTCTSENMRLESSPEWKRKTLPKRAAKMLSSIDFRSSRAKRARMSSWVLLIARRSANCAMITPASTAALASKPSMFPATAWSMTARHARAKLTSTAACTVHSADSATMRPC